MREEKTGGRAESFRAKIYCIIVMFCTELDRGLYITQNKGKLQKCINYQKYKEGSLGKRYKKLVKNEVNKTQEQVAKIRNLRNFAGCEIFATLQNLQYFEFFHFLLQFPFDF